MNIRKEDDLYLFQDSAGVSCVLTETQMWAIHNYIHNEFFIAIAQDNFDLNEEQARIVGSRAYNIYMNCDSSEENEALREAYKEWLDDNDECVNELPFEKE